MKSGNDIGFGSTGPCAARHALRLNQLYQVPLDETASRAHAGARKTEESAPRKVSTGTSVGQPRRNGNQ